jgi:hypothetical protein
MEFSTENIKDLLKAARPIMVLVSNASSESERMLILHSYAEVVAGINDILVAISTAVDPLERSAAIEAVDQGIRDLALGMAPFSGDFNGSGPSGMTN